MNGNPTRLSATEHTILSAIAELGSAYGLQLVRAHGVKRGTLYVLLDRLAKRDFVWSRMELPPVGEIGPSRRMYRVTDEGRRALKAWEAAKAAWSA